MLEAKHSAGTSKTGLNFVEDQKNAMPVAYFTQTREITHRRHDNSCLTLNRLDENGSGSGADRGLHPAGIAERHSDKARRERTEAAAASRITRKADDRRRTAMEIAFCDNDFGFTVRNAEVIIAETASRLYGGLDRFRPRIHRQAHIEPGNFGELFAKSAEFVGMISARDEIEPLQLAAHGSDETRMQMAEARSRITAHHIEIFFALDIENVHAPGLRQNHRKRRIIMGAEKRLTGNIVLYRRMFCRHGRAPIAKTNHGLEQCSVTASKKAHRAFEAFSDSPPHTEFACMSRAPKLGYLLTSAAAFGAEIRDFAA
jgi:hypothetical protein